MAIKMNQVLINIIIKVLDISCICNKLACYRCLCIGGFCMCFLCENLIQLLKFGRVTFFWRGKGGVIIHKICRMICLQLCILNECIHQLYRKTVLNFNFYRKQHIILNQPKLVILKSDKLFLLIILNKEIIRLMLTLSLL